MRIKIILISLIVLSILIVLFYSPNFLRKINEVKIGKISGLNSQFPVSAGVVPHHLLANGIIEDFFKYISSKEKPETIVLLGPDHFNAGDIVGDYFITLQPDTLKFQGMKIDNPLIENLATKSNLTFNEQALSLDHGITNLIPFIKKYLPSTQIAPFIIPVDIPLEDVEQFANALNSLVSPKTIVIGSCDFSHYLPSQVAEFHDRKSIRVLLNFEEEKFENLEVDCWQCLYGARLFAKLQQKESPRIIGYSNSADLLETTSNKENTSHFSIVFQERSKEIPFPSIEKANTILFVGDIMLDRGVAYLMKKNSVFHPFQKINNFLRGVDIIFGNLEGPIVKEPPDFSDQSLKFAFSPDVLRGLSFGNFNLLSLANNHTFNMGENGLVQTREFLKKAGIDSLGEPLGCDKDFLFRKNSLIFLAFNKTFSFNCSDDEIAKIVKEIRFSNPDKFLIVVFHWGQEYEAESSIFQQELAHKIIETGADLILGSHSHVVQDIEEYKGKLIFYSLGNFIFDQYFSKETQEELAVGLEIYPKKLIYRLFPIQSKLSQPFLMEQAEAEEFLSKLAEKSDQSLSDQIKTGIIKIYEDSKTNL